MRRALALEPEARVSTRLGHIASFSLMLLASVGDTPIYSLAMVVSAIAIGVVLHVPPPHLFVMSLPFVVVISDPFTIAASASDAVLPFLLAWLIWSSTGETRHTIVRVLRWPTVWALTLLGCILLSAVVNPVDWQPLVVAGLKLAIAVGGGFATIGVVQKYRSEGRSLTPLLQTWVYTSAAIAGIGAIAYLALMVGVDSGFIYQSARLQATFENPNAYAAYALVSLVLALLYAYVKDGTLTSIPAYLLLVSIVASNSRSAQIALVALSILGFALVARGRRQIVSWAWFSGATAGLLVLLIPAVNVLTGIFARLMSTPTPNDDAESLPGSSESGTVDPVVVNPLQQRESVVEDSRFDIWRVALELWLTSPLTGRGYGQFISLSQDDQAGTVPQLVHNSFLSFLTETGIIGAVVFAIPFVYVIAKLLARRSPIDNLMVIAIVLCCVMMLGNNLENARQLWVLLGLAYARVSLVLAPVKAHERGGRDCQKNGGSGTGLTER